MITTFDGTHQRPIGVLGTGSYRPSRIVTSDDVGAPAGVTGDWVARKTGIRERRWAKPDEATSDLAVAAAREALDDAGVPASHVSLVVVATSTPDSPQPPTASVVAAGIGADEHAAAFDVNVVCSGFVYALTVAEQLLRAAEPAYGLVVGTDLYSRILDPTDRRTVVLFGDAAGAVLMGPADRRSIVASRLLGAAGEQDLIGVAGGGSRLPASEETIAEGEHFFRMNGRAVRDFVTTRVPAAIRSFLADQGLRPEDIDHLIPHQANGRIIAELADDLGFANSRVHTTFADSGNTGAASVPLTLARAAREGRLRSGDRVLLVAFGGGMALGMTLLSWP